MRFTAHKEEIQRVVEILESDEYPDGEAMAKALINEVADMLWFRDWYVLCSLFEGVTDDRGQATFMFGPFAMDVEARSAGQKWAGMLVHPKNWAVMKLRGLGGTAAERKGGGFGFCTTEDCGHPAYAHAMAGTSRGWCVICGIEKCTKYEQAKPKAKSGKTKVAA